jgi:hypothetical protein
MLMRQALGTSCATGVCGRPLNWQFGPASRAIGHATYDHQSYAFLGLARRPFAPVHVRGRRTPAGDLDLSWIRRSGTGGDNWELPEVALGEETEAYEVDVLDGANVVRTLTTNTPAASYSQAQQLADLSAQPAVVQCRVHQMSATWGRGAAHAAEI